jgi:hypothetical protein
MSASEQAQPIGYITIPVYEVGDKAFAGLRQNMLSAGPHGVSTGGGVGSDAVYLEAGSDTEEKTRYCYVHGRDLLAAGLAMLGHEDWQQMPVSDGFVASSKDQEADPMDRCDCNIPYLEGAGQHSPGCAVFKDQEA